MCAPLAMGQPVVFVVQEKVPLADDVDPNVLLSPAVAEELARTRRVKTVLWSVGDPQFVEWIQPEKVQVDLTKPDLRKALDLARANQADFVMWVRATRNPEGIRPSAVLYERGRKVWSFEPKQEKPRLPTGIKATREDRDKWQRDAEALLAASGMLVVVVDGMPDWELTATSVARTWASQLGLTVFQRFPAAPEPPPTHLVGGSPLGGPGDTTALLAAADDAAAQGNTLQEVAALRRAVDTDPLNAAIRLRLVQTLMDSGMTHQADECISAAVTIVDDPVPFWQLGAEARLTLGNVQGARDYLGKMLALDSGSEETAGIIEILDGDPAAGLAALQAKVTPRAAVWRAVASAILGNYEGTEANLGLLTESDNRIPTKDYGLFVVVLERSLSALPETLRLLVPKIRSAGQGAYEAEARAVSQHCEALLALVTKLEPPDLHRRSHDGRRLAQSLLFQSARETLAFATSGDEDDRLNAGVSLTEAVRNLQAVRELHAAERRNAKPSLSGTGNGLDRGDGNGGGGRWNRLLGNSRPAAPCQGADAS